jgi:hypothetical protein
MTLVMKQEVESKLGDAFADLGFTRLQKRIFRAPWSTATIDHFLHLRWLEKYTTMISIQIGIRHREAQDFAATMLRTYGAYATRRFLNLENYQSLVEFSLGNLCSWPPPWGLDPAEMGADACVDEVTHCLMEKMFPLVGKVTDDAALYGFLTQTEFQAVANGATLAAEVIFIGKRLSYSSSKIMSDIQPFLHYIPSQIDEAVTTDEYLGRLWSSA